MSIGRNNNLRLVIIARREQARSNRRRELLILAIGSVPVLVVAILLAAYFLQIDLARVVAAATHGRQGAAVIPAEPAALAGTPLPPAEPGSTQPAPARTEAPAPNSSVNGVARDSFVVFTAAARQRARQIFAQGRSLGRNPHVVSKVGDSTMVYPPFLAAFAIPGGYRLGRFAYLQTTIDYYGSSLGRVSAAAKKGMHTWSEFDPAWVSSDQCATGETPLQCEFRLNNPSIAIIRLGANDTYDPPTFKENLQKIVEFWLARGVVPVLGTKPDRLEGAANTLNKIIRQTAAANNIPLWDYDLIAATVPNRGLVSDNVHLRGEGSHDFTLSSTFQSGDSLEDLTALMMLDSIRREISR